MALPLDQSIQRFISNDERMNTFANGNSAATYTTNTGEVVPSIQKFLSDKSAEVDANLNLSSPLPIGDVTPNSGAFTSLSATGALTTAGLKEDAAGNLGLGVTPSAWSAGKAIEIGNAGNGFWTYNGIENYHLNNAYYGAGGWKYASSNPAGYYSQYSGTHLWATAPSGTAGDPITFTQAMTLDASGNLLVGQTTPGYIDSNSIEIGSLGRVIVNHATGTSSGIFYASFGYATGGIGSITQSGTTAVAYNTTSDHRLKTNVRPADALKFMDIEFVDFEWIDGRHDCGVIAHQLQSVYPDLVLGEKDATEVRTVEITPAVPAVTEQVLVTPAVDAVAEVRDEGGNVTQAAAPAAEAVYETVEVTPAVPAVTEEQTFPVYQQVNYQGLIGRMGTRIQMLQLALDAQAETLAALEARLANLE